MIDVVDEVEVMLDLLDVMATLARLRLQIETAMLQQEVD